MNTKILFAALLLFFMTFTSCSKDDDTGGEGIKEHYMTLTIDGQQKSFSDVRGRWVDGGNSLELTGSNNNGAEWFTINILAEAARVSAGKYTLDDATAFDILSTYSLISNEGQLHHTATRGTAAPEDAFELNISKIDNGSAEGTFTGVLVNVSGLQTLSTVTVTNGKFKTSIKPN